ncbi:MAG TPA: hypothetical protein VN428_06990 [Bryobacteraceae bacterium]|nr:hypothetical protein [Bryobacteraceae bacterium]
MRMAILIILGSAMSFGAETLRSVASPQQPSQRRVEEHLEVPPPPFSEGLFPCSACHADLKPNPVRRVLSEMHTDVVLKHDEGHRWCLDCHDAANRDSLHLASGERISFDESYKLCGQCHGEKLRDWRAGVHGRRTGNWNGAKRYLLCAHCHNPHQPRFRALQPEAAPKRPSRIQSVHDERTPNGTRK